MIGLFCEFLTIIALFRRNRVRAAAMKSWPGNVIPTFKGPKCRDNVSLLEKLVEELLPQCAFSPPSLCGVIFGRNGIRQHILDTLNERRRVHGGYYYEQVFY